MDQTAPSTPSFPYGILASVALPLLACGEAAHGQGGGYQKPPQAILDILNAPPTPAVSLSPARDRLLLVDGERYPPLADLAQPMLRLAGHRINPRTNGPHRPQRYVGLTIQTIPEGARVRVEVPAGAHLGLPAWAPDGKAFAFTNTTDQGVELWLADAVTGQAGRVPGVRLNAAYGDELQWLPGSRKLLVQLVPASRDAPPAPPLVPAGPRVQESAGKAAPVRTFQDLLQTAHDEDLFDYYATSQLALVDIKEHSIHPVGKPGVFEGVQVSPNGKYLLTVRNHRPYSYLLTSASFPKEVSVLHPDGSLAHALARLPLADQVPIDGVPTGPRAYHWRPGEGATLAWVEALDGGDPKAKVPHRDRVLALQAPFDGAPVELAKTEQRFAGLTWGDGNLALLRDYDRDRRRTRTFLLRPDGSGAAPQLVWDRSIHDRYGDPGTPFLRTRADGSRVLWQQGDAIFLSSQGATPQGDRPFLDRFDLKTQKTERLFRSDAASLESVVALVADDASRFITRHESPASPPNFFLHDRSSGVRKPLTDFKDPAPQLRAVRKQLVTYKRADGVQLSFTLYLPPDYQEGQRLPTVLWAYPREYTDSDTAGQVSGSTNRFTTVGGVSHLFFLLAGYAVLDDATMPVVGDPETVNNTYLTQVVDGARAAIDKAVELGVTDRNRVGVGGHSYGAFMTANLLAHSDLFKAGIARSGAYNRTLTPFGFQSERRTLWEAPEVYLKMSPFMVAHKIKAPLLLIHGEADNNPGTFPIQSERLYQAVRGNGGTVRYVTLPHESHGYAARESVEHTLFEMIRWFDTHVKNAPGG